ncbi:AraC family transcriptional regulator [Nitratireductor aquibiodomus RA22]|uniref:AraC family transcriptional regulator n=1 Tax=Nitratireductor aquibiodomus RA22 TaxID=1189611 RepID=I5BVJ6_9HYPH|nr:GlxA family transcriptional regulator [Nitratireductor aquibiodomus]EIM73598.1 AraC family transcriptional regulator [Nitratireductor aquibiodomus RA22]
MVHRVGILLFPNYQLLDAAGPMAVFESVVGDPTRSGYLVELLSAEGGGVTSSGGATLQTRSFSDAGAFDTVLVCGGVGAVTEEIDEQTVRFLVRHFESGQRTGSVCTGAFLLAQAGCLRGKRVTTHWRYAGALAQRYPDVTVDADRIWVCDQSIWTSAGVSAGMDLAMAIVAEDHGASVARQIAQELVIYYRRPGGQSQFSALLEKGEASGRFSDLLAWIRENIDARHSVESLAARAAMSPRHFSRTFLKETGVTPARAVEQIRLQIAREWVERGTHSLSHIASATGYGSTDRMRQSFLRSLGITPQSIRRVF